MKMLSPLTPKQRVVKFKCMGFDDTYSRNGIVHLSCSQCQAIGINGVACHERGCPNIVQRED